jgi:hypothetical protein
MTISGRLNRTACGSGESEEQRSPLGLTISGRPVWPIYGAQPTDDDAADDDDTDDVDDDDSDDTDAADKSKKSKEDDKDDDSDLKDRLEDAEARAARYKKRMQAADRKQAELAARVATLENGGDKDKDAEPSEDLITAQKEVESLREANSTLRVENSFLLNNTFKWHDPKDVLALVLKDEDVEVDEDGEVQGMGPALKRIAKNKPWLVKKTESARDADTDDDDEDDDDDDEPVARRRQRSGGAQNGGKSRQQGLDRQKLLQTYPALNRR